MATKTYRPKADAGELSSVDIMLPNTQSGGDLLSVSEFPYSTEDPTEQDALDNHPLLTDRPPPPSASKKEKRAFTEAKTEAKEGS